MKNKKVLLAVAVIATLSLVACNRNANQPNNDVHNNDAHDYINDEHGHDDINDMEYDNNDAQYPNGNDYADHSLADTHLDFVSEHGFENVMNENGTTYHRRYHLNADNATDEDIFHSWRHTWVEPNEYVNEEIDLYRYTGYYNGERRTIHIMSHNGNPIGGYHFGNDETSEHGIMLQREGFFSRVADDFRIAWDDLFDVQR